MLNKKINIRFLLVIYGLSFLLNQVFFVDFKKVFAENTFSKTNLVAVIVDKDIYQKNEGDIKWYTTQYIQRNISNSKAIVLPINVKTIKSWDITKMLENIYFEGVEGKSSKLEGLILIGDVPLPVVNNNGYLFPTIYPYVDFENQKYVFDQKSDYFVLNSDTIGQAEVWHGWIKFTQDDEYTKFFLRLRDYQKDPSNYVMPRLWYDDFISLKKNFLSDNLTNYANSFIFSEDNTYHRYTNLFSDILKSDQNEDSMDIGDQLVQDMKNTDDESLKAYAQNIEKLSDQSKSLLKNFKKTETPTLLLQENIGNFIKSYDELISSRYLSKVKENLQASSRWYRKNSSGEIVDSIEGHYEKISKQDSRIVGDENIRSIFVELNDFLEKKINDNIQKQKYYLNVPIFAAYNEYTNENHNHLIAKDYCEQTLNNWYYNYYFGKKAFDITGMWDISIFNGTFLNYTTLEGQEVGFDPKKSIAGSYGIFSQQTESNRGYNVFNVEPEMDYREKNRIPEKRERECVQHFEILGIKLFCVKKGYKVDKEDPKEDPTYFAIRNRGGASPINLDDKLELKNYNYKNARLPIFDLGGTRKIKNKEADAYSYLGINTFGSAILVWDRYGEMKYPKYLDGKEIGIDKTRKDVSVFDFFKTYQPESGVSKTIYINTVGSVLDSTLIKQIGPNSPFGSAIPVKDLLGHLYTTGSVIPGVLPQKQFWGPSNKLGSPCNDYAFGKTYYYKTIPSIKYNISPTIDQISGMNLTTFDRPVDTQRNVTFRGIGGDLVKFDYPNLLQVQTFDIISGNLVIKNTGDITKSIIEYLKKQVDKYNFQLKNQNDKKASYYSMYSEAFNFLAQSDLNTSPNRSYENFSETFLEDSLVEFFDILVEKYGYDYIYGENKIQTKKDKIDFLSNLLYRINQNVYARKYKETVPEDIEEIRTNFDVNTRIASVVKDYLKKYDNGIFLNPNYNKTGYEVAFINSDGDNYLSSAAIPSFIKQLDNVKNRNDSIVSKQIRNRTEFQYKDTSSINNECGADDMGTVLLFDVKTFKSPWITAMICRVKKLKDFPYAIRFNFDKALGPVFVPGGVEDPLGIKETADNYKTQIKRNFSVLDNANKTEDFWEQTAETRRKLEKIRSYIDVDFGSNSWHVSDPSKKIIKISSNLDMGRINISISLTGDNCFGIKGYSDNLCKNKAIISSNFFEEPKELEVDFNDKKSGFSSLAIKFCLPSTNDCVEKQEMINLIPGAVEKISFLAPTKRVIPGAEIPIKVVARDKYDNLINQSISNFFISVLSGYGEFYYDGVRSNNVKFQNFKNADFIFRPSKSLEPSQINVNVSGHNENGLLISENLPISIVNGKLDIIYDGKLISNGSQITYDLGTKGYSLFKQYSNGADKISEEYLMKFSLRLFDQNGLYLESVAHTISQDGLVFPGILDRGEVYEGSKLVNQMYFINQNDFIFSGGKVDILYHPNFKSGKDKITLQIPGFDDININVTVLPGKEKRITVDMNRTNGLIGQQLKGTLKIFDEWGNMLDRAVPVKLGTIGATKIVGSEDVSINGKYDFSVKDVGVVGEGYFYTMLKNVSLDEQIPGYKRIIFQDNILPEDKLNVMYLNMFGADRGNQRGYFSDNNQYINKIFGKAQKTLAVTTQLVDDKKIKKTSAVVDQNAQIQNIGGIRTYLGFQSNNLSYYIGDIGYVTIGPASNFTISAISLSFMTGEHAEKSLFNTIFGKESSESDLSYNQKKLSYIDEKIKAGGNVIIYFSEPTDSVIKTNIFDKSKIVVNSGVVVDFSKSYIDEKVKIVLSQDKIGNYSMFDIYLGNKYLGQLFIWRSDNYILSSSSVKVYDSFRYFSSKIFADGSTNGKSGIGLIDTQTNMDNKNISIESSVQDDLGIGFQSSFKNITLFGQGKSVGQSTLLFGSEFLINFGDPVLKRISKNVSIDKTTFDAGIGQTIFSDPNKPISKTLTIDFNNDGLKDVLIVYQDGAVKLLKNYGGKYSDKNLNDLFVIEGGTKDVYVGDVDGNNYQDIVVRNNKNKMKVYNNNYGIFDVDGKLVCLNTSVDKGTITDTPDDLSDINQIFVKDMDMDGNIDIVTNDGDGYIKVFYGGGQAAKGGSNYVSSLDYTCDDQWYARQRNNEVLVRNYGVSIDSNIYVQDNSLVRRNGYSPVDDTSVPDIEVAQDVENESNYKSLFEGKKNKSDIQAQLSTEFSKITDFLDKLPVKIDEANLGENYVPDPIKYTPVGESVDKDIYYIPIKYLASTDKVSVYKQFSDINGGNLRKGDEVLVKVTIYAKTSSNITYIEELKGPWLVPTDENREIKTLYFGSNIDPDNLTIKRGVEPYQLLIDGVRESFDFYYKVYYDKASTPVVINVDDLIVPRKGLSKDGYNEITVNSEDSCLKGRYIYKSAGRNFAEIFDDVQEEVSDHLDEMDESQSEILKGSVDDIENASSISKLDGLINSYGGAKEKWTFGSILQGLLQEGGVSKSFDIRFIDSSIEKASDDIDKALNGLCQGFSLGKGGCSGMPVPFNQAFLAPGKYHLFGCFNLPLTPLDKGLPVFSFPTVGPINILGAPVPPFWPINFNGAGGLFGSTPPSSQFRLYVSPTLTLGLGFALCFGPYAAGISLPKPFRDIAGNCVVFALPPLSSKCKAATKPAKPSGNLVSEPVEDYLVDVGDNGLCGKGKIYKSEADSPGGKVGVVGGKVATVETPFKLVLDGYKVFEGNFGGFLRFDQEPATFLQENSEVSFEGLEDIDEENGFSLKAGQKVNLKILGGKAKGLVKCIVQDWMTRQVKYIVNNLSKMVVDITLPDFSTMLDGFDHLNMDNFSDTLKEIKKDKEDGGYTRKLTGLNDYFSNQALKNGSSFFDNPFQTILELFDKVPLINMETRDISIRVPILTTDQISSYWSYLKLWIEKNQKILQRWDDVLDSIIGNCGSKGKDPSKIKEFLKSMQSKEELRKSKLFDDSDECKKSLSFLEDYIDFNNNSKKLVYIVRQNLKTIDEYKKFPFKLYERIHITDRYIAETLGFVNDFVGKLIFWLNINANRFSQYIDSLTILIRAIKTWQVIVDFSLDWSEKCSKCTNDNYGAYSCRLSFLCPKLPILPIPNFRIPNIFIDLSHIDLGIDILLPQFNFTPMNISLPKIPDLPEPPEYQINLNISAIGIPDVSSIPKLPSPPDLPDLPSFIPSVEIDLPVLPPAPKIPNIAPKIEAILDVAKFIGKIFCILKGGIGLVGEMGVKAKIEQLTQRTWNVPIFDYFDLTTKFVDPPLRGFDWKLDAYLELRFNFDGVYQFFNSASSWVNSRTSEVQNWGYEKVEKVEDNINDQDFLDTFDDIEAGGVIKSSYMSPSEPEYLEYEQFHKKIKNGLNYFKQYAKDDKATMEKLDKISYAIDEPSTISVETDNIKKMKETVDGILKIKKKEYNEMAEKILNDYDGFIYDIRNKTSLISDSNQGNLSFDAKILSLDRYNNDLLSSQESPGKSYLDLNSKFIDGYLSALKTDGPTKLNMTQNTYDKSVKYLTDLKKDIRDVSDTQLYVKKDEGCSTCYAAVNPGSTVGSTSSSDVEYEEDMSVYTKGIYVDNMQGGQLFKINVMFTEDQVEKIGDKYFFEDINNDGKEDIMMRDDKSVYVKYNDQEDEYLKGVNETDSRYYLYSSSTNRSWIDSITDFKDDGFANFNSMDVKIFDKNFEVKNFVAKGQTFENLKFDFTNSLYLGDEVDGYVIRLNKRIDTFFDKYKILNFLKDDLIRTRYIVILPEDKYTVTGSIVSFDSISKKPLKSLMTGKVLGVRYFGLDQDTISVVLNEVDRAWQYAQIATLKVDNDGLSIFQEGKYTSLKQSSPWSNQILGGRQLISDSKGPTPLIYLYRPSIKKAISTGNFHQGYVNTLYDLNIKWTDDVAVSEMWILYDGKLLKKLSNKSKEGNISINNLSFTGNQTLKFEIGAKDFEGNVATQDVELSISIPDINIIDVTKVNNTSARIISEISHDLDRGIVTFEKMLNNSRTNIKGGSANSYGGYDLIPLQTVITGGLFNLSDTIGLFDDGGIKFAGVDPTNGKIIISQNYESKFTLKLGFIENFLNVLVFDKQKNINSMEIKLSPNKLISVDLLQGKPNYELTALYGTKFGVFDSGYCLKNISQDCMLYLSMSGDIYSPAMYSSYFGGNYIFNITGNYVNYIIRDQLNKALLDVKIEMKNLIK